MTPHLSPVFTTSASPARKSVANLLRIMQNHVSDAVKTFPVWPDYTYSVSVGVYLR